MHILRKKEIHLLVYVFLFILLGQFTLKITDPSFKNTWQPFIHGVILGLCFFATSLFLSYKNPNCDSYIMPLTAFLLSVGMVILYRLTPTLAEKQFYWILVGLALFVVTTLVFKDYEKLSNYKYLYILAGLLLLLISIVFGKATNGATSWIVIGGFSFQPSELVKVFMVLFLASYLDENRDLLIVGNRTTMGFAIPSFKYLGPLVIMWGMSLALLVLQKDLGTALIFFSTFMAMIYISTSRISYVVGGMLLFILGAYVSYKLFGHVRVRFVIWLNPWKDITGGGYQIVQSLFAIGSGGFFGTGLGLGFPKMIPVVESDFIFSAISEEMGLFGAVGLILVYIFLVYRGFKVALANRSDFGTLIAAGLTALLAIQAFVIIAGVSKLLPLTGITLPFISYGGSSIIVNFIIIALLLNISGKDSDYNES